MKKEIRKQVIDKCGGRCAYCGEEITLKDMQVDHIISQRNFYIGRRDKRPAYEAHDIQNLNPSCRRCNNFKGGMTIEELRVELGRQVERARRDSVNFRMAEKYGLIQAKERPIVFYFEKL